MKSCTSLRRFCPNLQFILWANVTFDDNHLSRKGCLAQSVNIPLAANCLTNAISTYALCQRDTLVNIGLSQREYLAASQFITLSLSLSLAPHPVSSTLSLSLTTVAATFSDLLTARLRVLFLNLHLCQPARTHVDGRYKTYY